MSQERPKRQYKRRNAVTTRATILAAAHEHFTREGYESVGVRDIAATAGVDAALVIRYFGSKERLFAEAITEEFDLRMLVVGDRATLGERLARYMLHKGEMQGSFDSLLALLRSGPGEQGEALRRAIDEQFIEPLAQWLGGANALERASLIASYMLGIAVTRDVIRSEHLTTDEIEPLVALMAPTLQAYIDG